MHLVLRQNFGLTWKRNIDFIELERLHEMKRSKDFEELEKILRQQSDFRDKVVNAFVKKFARLDTAVIDMVHAFCVTCQRTLLCIRLQKWMPERVAMWAVNRWPERWLPTFNTENVLERMKGD